AARRLWIGRESIPQLGVVVSPPMCSNQERKARSLSGGSEGRVGGGVTTKAILSRGRALIEQGWCQGVDARDENGQRINPWNPRASSWSLLGALVTAEDVEREVVAHVQLDQFAQAVALL